MSHPKSSTAKPEVIARRKTYDDRTVLVWSDGDLTNWHGVTWTRHRPLDVPTALLVAGEAMLFDSAEMPSLIAAAHRLKPRSPRGVLPGDLRAEASRMSHRAGTRPADVAPPPAPPKPKPPSKTRPRA